MKAITFFTGVGMFDLGLHAAGFEIVAQVEIEEFCQDVLRARWSFFSDNRPPEIYGDIRTITGDDLPSDAELFFGGFPCQPFSNAGYKKGETDNRNMWGEFYRVISEYLPRWVVLENVPGITIPNNGKPAYALTILRDLATLGYDSRWTFISAQDCGLPHKRERWFCIAEWGELDDTSEYRLQRPYTIKKVFSVQKPPQRADKINARNEDKRRTIRCKKRSITKSRLDGNADGITAWMDRPIKIAGRNKKQHELEPPRMIEGNPPQWSKRVKAIGNGGIPQIAYNIGKYILKIEGK